MGIKMNAGQMKRTYKQMIAKNIDADLAVRADRVVDKARADVPYLTGRLHDSIRKVKLGQATTSAGYRIIADAKGDGQSDSYALGVEIGHAKRGLATPKDATDAEAQAFADLRAISGGNVAAQPYLLPALEAAGDD